MAYTDIVITGDKIKANSITMNTDGIFKFTGTFGTDYKIRLTPEVDMGYNSEFELEYIGDAEDIQEFHDYYEDSDGKRIDPGGYELDPTNSAEWESMKWYDHDDDMKRFSLVWPKLTFILRRAGDESSDLEMSWYRNGQLYSAKAKITFVPPPESFYQD